MTGRFTIHNFETLPSTQTLAQEWVREKRAKPGDVIMASQQTAAYGRRGRAWQAPQGNLYFTLIEDHFNSVQLSWISYAMGLGLYDAVSNFLPVDTALKLKWPNDLLLNGAKLSGLLIEIVDDKMLIGVGLNVAEAPQTDQATVCLNDIAKSSIDPLALLQVALPRYDHWYQTGLTEGFGPLRDIWLKHAAGLDMGITARLADGKTLEGQFVDLDPTGGLVLDTGVERHVITAADIYLKQVA